MGKNQSASNLTNIIKQDGSGNIVFTSGSTTLATISTSGQLSGSTPALSASYAATSSYATNFNVSGTITATTLVVQTVTSSVVYSSGSNVFGNNIANMQVMTGSVRITGSLAVITNGTELNVGATGVTLGNVVTDAHNVTGSMFVSGNLQLGTNLSNGVGTATPVSMSMGSTFGTNPTGSNFKLKLYDDTTPNPFGIGVSNALLEIIAGTSGNIGFFTNGSERMRITSAGAVSINTGGPALLTLGATNSYTGIASGGGGATLYMNGSTRGGADTAASNAAVLATDGIFYITNGAVNINRMVVSGSNLGIGTAPGLNLHIATTGTAFTSTTITFSGATSRGIFLDQSNGASDNGNGIWFNNSGLYSAIASTREFTGDWGTDIRFYTHPKTTSNQYDVTERMRIRSDGSVLIGATSISNSQRFAVVGSGVWDGATIGLQNTGTGGQTYTLFSTNNTFSQGGGNFLLYNNNTPTNCLIVYPNGNYVFAGSNVSDRRLKQDIEDINFGLNEIMQLSPKSYHLKSENNLSGANVVTLKKRYGFIAQEVQSVLPDTITGQETETEYLGLDYNGVLTIAIKAIQELNTKLDAANAEIEALKNK